MGSRKSEIGNRKLSSWAQWKVGIAGARKAMWGKKIATKGTLLCHHCGTDGHSYLLENGRCKDCHIPKPVNLKYTAHKIDRGSASREQLALTLQLRNICDDVMQKNGIKLYKFGEFIGIPKSTFIYWYNGNLTEDGQRANNEKILSGLRRIRNEVAA